MQPSREARIAADEAVADLRRDKKSKTSVGSRSTVVKAALAKEPESTLRALMDADDRIVVLYFIDVLEDAMCIGDPGEMRNYYDLKGWSANKGDMPNAEQVRTWAGSLVSERDDGYSESSSD